ncbi:MAG: DUF1837 domain-containing protein [Treponema sp.]|nr:DUF1837 domain-containing protein [Treponema sp.]
MSYGFLNWFVKSKNLLTEDGKNVEIWSFNHRNDDNLLSEWATHFREMYSEDELLDEYRKGTGLSRANYLLNMIFPDRTDGFGPATRAGDFAELLVADFLEFLQGYWIPRVRYDDKATRNSSTQGSDVVGIKIQKSDEFSKNDELLVFEVKAQFSGNSAKPRLQDAVNDSNKDVTRVGEFLNYTKRRFIRSGKLDEKNIIERFQNISDKPYIEKFGAAALFDKSIFDEHLISETDCSEHSEHDKLTLLVFSGQGMMALVHSLYERAANEA